MFCQNIRKNKNRRISPATFFREYAAAVRSRCHLSFPVLCSSS
ncbi:hypothetical protein CLOM621_08765 [Clostridium sp. M62/1]|nr:hypothetical protein CLOM621_08765 [Clostridium sp. M62/1]